MAPSKHKELGTKRFVNRGTVVTCPPRQDAQARKHTPRPKTPVSRKASSRPLQRFLSCSQPSLLALTCLKIQICKRSFVSTTPQPICMFGILTEQSTQLRVSSQAFALRRNVGPMGSVFRSSWVPPPSNNFLLWDFIGMVTVTKWLACSIKPCFSLHLPCLVQCFRFTYLVEYTARLGAYVQHGGSDVPNGSPSPTSIGGHHHQTSKFHPKVIVLHKPLEQRHHDDDHGEVV